MGSLFLRRHWFRAGHSSLRSVVLALWPLRLIGMTVGCRPRIKLVQGHRLALGDVAPCLLLASAIPDLTGLILGLSGLSSALQSLILLIVHGTASTSKIHGLGLGISGILIGSKVVPPLWLIRVGNDPLTTGVGRVSAILRLILQVKAGWDGRHGVTRKGRSLGALTLDVLSWSVDREGLALSL